jgi:hypothetical protein
MTSIHSVTDSRQEICHRICKTHSSILLIINRPFSFSRVLAKRDGSLREKLPVKEPAATSVTSST